jgi:hypothetical protein
MILSNRFVFIHMPKTGGSFVRELLTHHAPADWQIELHDNHPSIRDIPPTHKSLPIFGLVRNPFDWYVSWYHYLLKHRGDPFFDQVSDQGKRDFVSTLSAAFEVDIGSFFNFPCHYTGSPFGCYMNYLFGNDLDRLKLGKMEHLRDDLREILSGFNALTPTLDEQIDLFPVVNASEHHPSRSYYTARLRDLILERDASVLNHFDYHF